MQTPTKEQLADPKWWDANAPEGAEYAKIFVDDEHVPVEFYRISNDWYEYFDIQDNKWILSDGSACMLKASAISRPDKQWRGPEDGLPPVGEKVEAGIPHVYGANDELKSIIWVEGSVIAYFECGHKTYAWFESEGGFYPPNVLEFRPIRTPEQIAAEERENAIEEMILIDEKGSLSRTYFCGLLYDAGYRKCSE